MSAARAIQGITCRRCGRSSLRGAGPCPACGHAEVARHAVPAEGPLVSWTVIRRPPAGSSETGPYVVAVVRLGERLALCGRVRTPDFAGPVGAPMRLAGMEGEVPLFETATREAAS